MEQTTIFPEYKHAGEIIAAAQRDFFSDEELVELLKADLETKTFQFRLLALKDYLLNEKGMDLIRVADSDKRGQKIATCSESLKITVQRLSRRVKNAAQKQRTVLGTIDRAQLTDDESKLYDRNTIKNGLLLCFLDRTKRIALPQNSTVRIDVPKVIQQ